MLLAKRNDSEDHSPIPWLVLKRRCVAVFEAPIDTKFDEMLAAMAHRPALPNAEQPSEISARFWDLGEIHAGLSSFRPAGPVGAEFRPGRAGGTNVQP
jgi:hypothetical protein